MNDSPPQRHTAAVAAEQSDDSRYLVFGQVAEQIEASLRAGRRPDVETLVAEHPEMAQEIRQLVSAQLMLRELGHPSPDPTTGPGPDSTGTPAFGQLGDYRILREIGRGGMGVVYEAEQISLHRRVALKVLPFAAVLDPRHLQRFKNEAQAAASLEHPNIVNVYAVGCERGVHYYAMQYVEGQTLAEVIAGLRPKAEGGRRKGQESQWRVACSHNAQRRVSMGRQARGQGPGRTAEGGRGKGEKETRVSNQNLRRPPSPVRPLPHPLTPSPPHLLRLPPSPVRLPPTPSPSRCSRPKARPAAPSFSAPWPGWASRRPRPWNTPTKWASSTATSSPPT